MSEMEIVPLENPNPQLILNAYTHANVIEGLVLKREDIPDDVLAPVDVQGWTEFLKLEAPVYPNLVFEFYDSLQYALKSKVILSKVAGVDISISVQNLADWFHPPLEGLTTYTKKGWMAESDSFSIEECLRLLNTNPKAGDTSLRRPEVQGLKANNFILLKIIRTDLRETAYEIVIGACRSSGSGRPLKYVSNSADRNGLERSESMSSFLFQRSMPASAPSKVKKALGLKSKKKNCSDSMADAGEDQNSMSRQPASTVGELIRVQMKVSEQTDSRVRRGLLRVAAGQLGRRIESYVLPMELLQHLKISDFPSQQKYEAWQRRILMVLEAGLLLHPSLPLLHTDSQFLQLSEIIHGAMITPIDTGKYSNSMQGLRNVVLSLASRSFDGSVSQVCHWADGIPLNLRLYEKLLEACFEVDDATTIIEEVDEFLEIIKKTWVILGIDQMLHNICFLWVLFHHYVISGQNDDDLLFAAEILLLEVNDDAQTAKDSTYVKLLSSTLGLILGWAEKKLLAYHYNFYRSNIDIMRSVLSIATLIAKLVEGMFNEYHKKQEGDVAYCRVDNYIRSSLHKAFTQASYSLSLDYFI
ncbi:unnamed protein product [Cuscuta campestris]|uniref:Uncharacterized protein n=1 Tax=Cuscuta campestris TaxID=132261 RepID=A0A484KRH3_9ASTE|nr:unnamed protein product [Cuscuta campestris]